MSARALRWILLAAGPALLVALAAGGEPLAIGDRLEPVGLEDQPGESHTIDTAVKRLLFSRDMDGGDVLKEAVADQTGESLGALGAVYVADIHEMPGLVARLFAIPAMRKRAYPVLLDRDGTATANLPDEEGKATILVLDGLVLKEAHHLATVEAVRAQLGLAAREAD